MKVYLNNITGIPDAIISMYMSKRSWTPELNQKIIDTCRKVFNERGFMREFTDRNDYELVTEWVDKLFKWGKKHITLLRYVDFSCTVEGLHRGAQDDFDSHTKRLENRIIRSSTRLSTFGNEKSDFYKDKILTTDEVCELTGIQLPAEVLHEGKIFVKTCNGYVHEKYKDNKDVLRGLYMLSIPSNFIFKCNITEWSHIVKERDLNSHAAPELQNMVESVINELKCHFPQLTREYYYSICN